LDETEEAIMVGVIITPFLLFFIIIIIIIIRTLGDKGGQVSCE